MEKVLQWRAALTQAANHWRLFAVQERMEKIENLLDIECSTDVRIIGIWGMGSIGKTTLASAVFHKFAYSHFEGRSCVRDVRQQYETKGPNKLRTKLLTLLFNDEDALISMDTPLVVSPFIQDRLCRKKVLIGLDDVDSSVQLEALVEGYHQLAPGSRILVTSRNKQVLKKIADEIYKVEELNNIESLKLFHLHAFGRNSYPTEYYETLSKRVASYADGNPLALKVLGSFLHSKSEEEWESALEKLRRVPNNDILKVLRISYVGLDDEGIKNIFLDIACFFDEPFTREYAESILDGGDFSAKIGISVLIDKSLLEISHKENYFRMHDLIRQMGWSVVSDEHRDPGNRSRLFDANDVCHVLEKNTFLKIYCDNIDSNKFKIYLPRGLEPLVSNELRYFRWEFYPLESLPSDFTPENLVELILCCSLLKQLENHVVKSLPKLKKMDLSNSKLLTRIADLSQAPNLESINLEGCTSLFHVLSSLQNLHKLTHLNLKGCNNLELGQISGRRGNLDIVQNLSKNICHLNFTLLNSFITGLLKSLSTSICKLKSLRLMNLGRCSNLEEFPEFLEPMEDLTAIVLDRTATKKLPQSIENLIGLKYLYMGGCKEIEYLPKSLCGLSRLYLLNLSGCSKLQKLPPCPLGLKVLNVNHCEGLKLIEEVPPNLTHFDARRCTSLEMISSQTNKSYPMCISQRILDIAQGFISSARICYPGDEIPNEYTYQSMGSSMNINLPPNWNGNGFLVKERWKGICDDEKCMEGIVLKVLKVPGIVTEHEVMILLSV
ncbi:hypothetical protein FNV43_RR00523 [Rhamnella rubrinervis]|uniref:ADP-ribosyl cyclase/cyclic ADP-ribose hydrolase n=1 Tax=Rhamnella rubrinervis TaxID=2594499 RepID=A0A8K0HMZ7_9ROSA|nr:hypothetical protein FNV43_RR00523 [Rhamnella rubrinervis]